MYETHEEFITWASKYEFFKELGRNLKSQVSFVEPFNGAVLKIIREETEEYLLEKALSFIKI